MLLIVLVVVLVGSVLAATTTSLPLLIVGRVLQAASYALYPISIAILREELPAGPTDVGDGGAVGDAGLRRRQRPRGGRDC